MSNGESPQAAQTQPASSGGTMPWGAAASTFNTWMSIYANKKASRKAWRRFKAFQKQQIQWRVADAKAAGIHPLAALGISPAGGPIVSSSAPDLSGISEAGQQIGDFIDRRNSRKLEVEAHNMAMAIGDAERRMKEAEATRRERMLNSPVVDATRNTLGEGGQLSGAILGSPGNGQSADTGVGAGTGALVVPNEVPATEAGRPGLAAGPKPFTHPSFDTEGFYVGGPDMEGSMKMQSDPRVRWPVVLRGGRKYIRRLYHSAQQLWDPEGSHKWFKKDLENLPKLPKGWHYVYHPIQGTYQAVPYSEWKKLFPLPKKRKKSGTEYTDWPF